MQNKGAKQNWASFTPLLCCLPCEEMEKIVSCILLLLGWSTTSSKYVYITNKKTWHDAQKYCLEHHADLAHISNENDNGRLCSLTKEFSWFGLQRDFKLRNQWRWSGGGNVSLFFWADSQLQNRQRKDYGMFHCNGWHDSCPDKKVNFLCYSPIVVSERKTWEEAMGYCKQHHNDLASLQSETEMMLISKKLQKIQHTESLWIGLHFFSGEWLWVDGESSRYKAWGQGKDPTCPNYKQACGALRLKSYDRIGVIPEEDSIGSTINSLPREWEAHNCDDKLNFICY